MAKSVLVTYVGPFDAVEVAATGQVCAAGKSISVAPDLAGRPPAADGSDLGEGLLAQTSNWVAAKATSKPTQDGV